jgi:iron-sulfur cluster repair protein YtfE (RIC family)
MDAIDLLKKDHAKVEDLFQRFDEGGGITGMVKRLAGSTASPRARRSLAERICGELDVHARIEEEVFYPAVRRLQEAELEPLLEESLKEHATIKQRVQEVRSADAEGETLRERVSRLRECVEHHVQEEEGRMFPLLEDRLPEDARNRLGRELAARKRRAKPARRKAARRAAPARTRRGRGTRKTAAKARKKTTRKRASGGRRR